MKVTEGVGKSLGLGLGMDAASLAQRDRHEAFVGDLGRLDSLKSSDPQDPTRVKAVTQEFQALFLQLVVQQMRTADKPFKSQMGSSRARETWEELYDKQLVLQMAKNDNGLAGAIERQLMPSLMPAVPGQVSAASEGEGLPLKPFKPFKP